MTHPPVNAAQDAEILLDLLPRKPHTLIDFGCNQGDFVNRALALGVEATGIDVSDMIRNLKCPPSRFVAFDLTKPGLQLATAEVGLCLEVAEHLPESGANNLIHTLVSHCDLLMFSAAKPGQPGWGHINCQPDSYWAEKFAAHHWAYDTRIRSIVKHLPSLSWWYRQNLTFCYPL